MRALRIRHYTTPLTEGCRWCGHDHRGHANRWVPSHGWHAWVEPTKAQRDARMRVRRGLAVAR